MPSPLHEQLLELMRGRPAFAAELLRNAAGLRLGAEVLVTARTGGQSFVQLQPPEYRADLVIELGTGRSELAIIVEVQLGIDDEKRGSWPQYVAALWGRLRCPVWLLVVTVDAVVAKWCAQRIETGGMQLRPVVIGPDDIPVVTDAQAALDDPELAVLSALAHAASPQGLEICKGAAEAVMLQRVPTRYTCIDLMLSRLPEAARRALEEFMSQGYEYQSEFFRRLVAEGKAEGKAEAILAVLAARGVSVPDHVVARLHSCHDLGVLERWLRRAVLVSSAEDLLG